MPDQSDQSSTESDADDILLPSAGDADSSLFPKLSPDRHRHVSISTMKKSRSARKRVGPYQIGATLGKGSFGVVKIGIHVESGIQYALKFLSKKQVTDISEVERLFRESAILTSLKCDNIIRLVEVIDDVAHIVMVMELAQGGELLDLIKTRLALPERDATRYFAEIVAGVEYCHRRNVVHRDLKLENILMVDGKVKIADFGLSNTAMMGKSEMGTACGTPSYLAPEQINRESGGIVGAQADIWAMGVILFAMVAGFLPFQAKNTPALFKKIINVDFSYPDFFSEELRDLLGRMLTPVPEMRATIGEIKSHVWYLMDVSESSSRQVTEEMVRAARDKQAERGQGKIVSRKPSSEANRSVSSVAPKTTPTTPSNKLPPVSPMSTPKHSRQPSVSRLNSMSTIGSSTGVGSGAGQFRMRSLGASRSASTTTPTPTRMGRMKSWTMKSGGTIDVDALIGDSDDDRGGAERFSASVHDRLRALPKIPSLKKVDGDDGQGS